MSQNRHRSVPKGTGAPLSPPSSQPSANFAPALTASKPFPDVAYSSTQTTPNSPKSEDNQLLKQAEALANMHFELNLHTVFSLASRLEKEVQQLVFRTADDQEFRRQNEERMTKMMIEVQTVKAYMARMGHNHEPATRADIERLQQAMSDTTMEWNNQLEDARTKIDEISGRMINVSRHAGVRGNEPQTSPSLVGIETRAMRKAKTDIISGAHQQQTSPSSSTLESRINDAINSTKRWNREHKTTKMRENQFIISYLKKQGQRDPVLAKVLLQAIRERASNIKTRTSKAKKLPSLEETCRNTSWQDVIDSATEVLVVNKTQTLQFLKQA
ncbi:hypothetical protein FOPG_05776 [Fusarium oxysporum f. sp. conglutinans race 2 54008]|uniref:Uncharacterized protein n=4 Tax=Fusarium oxysporum TaxID=5507 RepID=A0A8H6H5C4_FUSOX|nr:hypothetical protein FOXB_02163 [Fusarium oxysporum f. sp. conglutinans Fo5176]EXA53153.1 hypothetical protein FOVG_01110 [Fusarium oxysporum f. sp. pisi HDV247]EXL80789.1 hypothetical protein FOPG_05776 [Fusarium oxysporum f. sp. conglutinans race 2 54008]KAF6529481.1 hypothetical protein HZS61_000793 [Fusarium oxysporum f. sp. conglutinans]KAG6992441.1 hypothetical protein FocnCong_v018797 [Fusarium oxysporum f. sp. conglutinans]